MFFFPLEIPSTSKSHADIKMEEKKFWAFAPFFFIFFTKPYLISTALICTETEERKKKCKLSVCVRVSVFAMFAGII